jgi:16S rRNA (cytosine1402-N4)-methyltransferase
MEPVHIPVMRAEIIEAMKIKSSGIYVDATVGLGGHAEGMLQQAGTCTVIGIDRDESALAIARERLKEYPNVYLVQGSFSHIQNSVHDCGYDRVDGILVDTGVSTLQLKSEERGFSFLSDAPLDMRMDMNQRLTAGDIISRYREKELADVIWRYGEERFSRRIAKAITTIRRKKPVRTCRDLSSIIEKVVGRRGRIHPATRTFQALRIEVNKELDELSTIIDEGTVLLNKGGRMCVLSYHSLEDRIVKNTYKKLGADGMFSIITKKPITPREDERRSNRSSRSAKLRILERVQ